ncbi:MAG: hypothetical protein R2698_06340 [Microthrixaceae bacterium]
MFASEPAAPEPSTGIVEATLRYRRVTAVLAIAGLVLAAIYTLAQPSEARAVGRVSLTDPRGSLTYRSGSSVVDFARYLNERVEFTNSGTILQATAKSFPAAGTPADIRSRCKASAEDGTSVMTVECRYSDARTAVGTVDAIVASYRKATKEQAAKKAQAALDALKPETDKLNAKLDQLKSEAGSGAYATAVSQATVARLNTLQESETDIRSTQALFGDGTEAYDYARVPATAGRLSTLVRNGLIGGVLGLLGAMLVAWFRADRDPVADDAVSVADWVGLPSLGEITVPTPADPRLDLLATPEPMFQRVAANVDAVLRGTSVLFTAVEPLERHEDIVIKTALVAARAGRRVLLIDGDQAGRAVSAALGLPEGLGLEEFIAGAATAGEAVIRVGLGKGPGSPELFMMGPGGHPGQAPSLFRSADMADALRELRGDFDLIIVDGPPLLASAGSSMLGQVVDGIAVIVASGTARADIEDARRQLHFLAGDGVGFVFVDAD